MNSSSKFNWGIAGCGRISRAFAKGLQNLPNAHLKAVASNYGDSSRAFAEEFKAEKVYTSYHEMAESGSIDAVYIGNLHPQHYETTMLFLEHKIPVLVEKPFCINAKQAEQMIAKAKEKKCFLMEAIWTRFLPATKKLLEVLESGEIGEVRSIRADFGIDKMDEQDRWQNPEKAGGALLDLGIYTLYFSHLVTQDWPDSIESNVQIGKTGVDNEGHYFLKYKKGVTAMLSSSVNRGTERTGVILGTDGMIKVPQFFHANRFTVYPNGKEEYNIEAPQLDPGYSHEAECVMQCLENGELQCDLLPWETSLKLMKQMDEFRAQWGLKYPME